MEETDPPVCSAWLHHACVLPHGSKQQGKYFVADTAMKNSRNRDDDDKIFSIFFSLYRNDRSSFRFYY